jgi:hypothetical protein
MKFSNILISKKQFLCNTKPYCTLVPRNFIHWFCTRVQYDYLLQEPYVIKQLLHLNLINMRFYGAEYNNIELGIRLVQYCCTLLHKTSYCQPPSGISCLYWSTNTTVNLCQVYYTITALERDLKIFWTFSNILISKEQFLCNKKPYCTLVPRNFFLLMKETEVTRENHGPVASHWQSLSHNVVVYWVARFEHNFVCW